MVMEEEVGGGDGDRERESGREGEFKALGEEWAGEVYLKEIMRKRSILEKRGEMGGKEL